MNNLQQLPCAKPKVAQDINELSQPTTQVPSQTNFSSGEKSVMSSYKPQFGSPIQGFDTSNGQLKEVQSNDLRNINKLFLNDNKYIQQLSPRDNNLKCQTTENRDPNFLQQKQKSFTKPLYIMKPIPSLPDSRKQSESNINQQQNQEIEQQQQQQQMLNRNPLGVNLLSEGACSPFNKVSTSLNTVYLSHHNSSGITSSQNTNSQEQTGQQILLSKCKSSTIFSEQPIKSTHANIFQEEIQKYQKQAASVQATTFLDIGPRFSKQGDLVPYSIIGKTEWFTRLDSKQGDNSKPQMLKPPKLSKVINQSTVQQLQSKSNASSNQKQLNIPSVSSKSYIMGSGRKKQDDTKVELSKEKLLCEISQMEQEMKQKQQISKQQEEQELKKIAGYTNYQNTIFKQEKTLKRYDQQSSKWNSLIQRIGVLSQRKDFDNFLINRSSKDHRQKVELLNLIDLTKTPQQLLGVQAWELSLRSEDDFTEENNNAKKKHVRHSTQLQNSQRHQQSDGLMSTKDVHFRVPSCSGGIYVKSSLCSDLDFQIMRKPVKNYSLNEQPESNGKFQSQSMQDFFKPGYKGQIQYIQQKIDQLPKRKKYLQQMYYSNFEDLMLKGEGKFDLEKKCIIKDGRSPQSTYWKYHVQDDAEQKDQNQLTKRVDDNPQADNQNNDSIEDIHLNVQKSVVNKPGSSMNQRNSFAKLQKSGLSNTTIQSFFTGQTQKNF